MPNVVGNQDSNWCTFDSFVAYKKVPNVHVNHDSNWCTFDSFVPNKKVSNVHGNHDTNWCTFGSYVLRKLHMFSYNVSTWKMHAWCRVTFDVPIWPLSNSIQRRQKIHENNKDNILAELGPQQFCSLASRQRNSATKSCRKTKNVKLSISKQICHNVYSDQATNNSFGPF